MVDIPNASRLADKLTEEEPKPRRGRKLKPDAEKRSVKFSIYLTPKVHEALRDLAASVASDISDLILIALEKFIENNDERLQAYRNFKACAKPF